MTTQFDKRELRNVLGAFVTGVTVVTTLDGEGKAQGVTANSFSSVSLEPPLVLWSQALAARSFPAFRDSDRFVVNILARDQVDISQKFASGAEDKFTGVRCISGLGGVPVIDGCSAFLECRRVATYPGGDHVVFLGQVENFQRSTLKPLAFGGGRYMVAYAHELGDETGHAPKERGRQSQSEILRIATPLLPEMTAQLGKCLGLGVWGNRGPVTVRWELCPDPPSGEFLIGSVLSLVNSATGRAFAAFLPRDVIEPILSEELAAARAAGSEVPTAEEIDARIAETRRYGVARRVRNHQPPEHSDIDAFSAPVYDRSGTMALALTMAMRVGETGPEWDGPLPRKLVEVAAALSRELGYREKSA